MIRICLSLNVMLADTRGLEPWSALQPGPRRLWRPYLRRAPLPASVLLASLPASLPLGARSVVVWLLALP
jgi:hypothetical protein